MKTFKTIMPALAAYVILTVIFGTIYATAQQNLRLSANDPQIQIAEDAAAKLDNGAPTESLVGGGEVNLNKSLATFVQIYNKEDKLVAGNAFLSHTQPVIPSGVLTATGSDYHAVTWQPATSVRTASVAVRAKDFYVVSGRSLKEVERRENQMFALSSFGWLISVITVSAICIVKWARR